MNRQRYVLLAFVSAAALMGLVAQAAVESFFAQMAIADDLVLGFVSTSTLIALAAFGATAFGLVRSKRAVSFTDEVIGELARVTWPTRDEAMRATATVVLTTLFVAALLGAYDLLWKNVADIVLFNEG